MYVFVYVWLFEQLGFHTWKQKQAVLCQFSVIVFIYFFIFGINKVSGSPVSIYTGWCSSGCAKLRLPIQIFLQYIFIQL